MDSRLSALGISGLLQEEPNATGKSVDADMWECDNSNANSVSGGNCLKINGI